MDVRDLAGILTKAGAAVIVMVPNLDNGIMNDTGISNAERGVCEDMSKQFKERVQIGTLADGTAEYRWATGNTKSELQANIAKVLMGAGMLTGASSFEERQKPSVTVRTFIEETYAPTFITHLAPTTRENYRQYIALNILPFMGDLPMDQVSVATIQQFYDWMATAAERGRKKNLNAKTIERVGGLMNRIFKVALEMRIVKDTPFKQTLLTIRAEEAGHHEALPDKLVAEIRKKIPTLEDRDERIYMALLTSTGMRPEEVRGMSWEETDLEGQYGTVTKAVTYPCNSKPHVGKPKSKRSGRTVLFPKSLVDILLPERQPSGFICGGEHPWCYSKAARVSDSAFKHLGLEGYTDYDFRATFGTQLKESGMTSAQVADVMGHADTRMVETVYARARHEGIMKRLAEVEKLTTTAAL